MNLYFVKMILINKSRFFTRFLSFLIEIVIFSFVLSVPAECRESLDRWPSSEGIVSSSFVKRLASNNYSEFNEAFICWLFIPVEIKLQRIKIY